MTYDHWKATEHDSLDNERHPDCTCRLGHASSADIGPPHIIVDEWCPIHGRDPDYEMERRRDDARDDARDIEEDRADDYDD